MYLELAKLTTQYQSSPSSGNFKRKRLSQGRGREADGKLKTFQTEINISTGACVLSIHAAANRTAVKKAN